ncbi:hypothetical protein BpHYR1_022915 [Brachionus plicatilis]|uniref:Uncharacterized protein n=1 Tax=Brachionus plicatilis TaxID=10195 RepID=A0A3M7T5H2_BRAPC|nr:hypothetical protein BpHYR1_022915 [Brachionus plicatilis]
MYVLFLLIVKRERFKSYNLSLTFQRLHWEHFFEPYRDICAFLSLSKGLFKEKNKKKKQKLITQYFKGFDIKLTDINFLTLKYFNINLHVMFTLVPLGPSIRSLSLDVLGHIILIEII